MIVRLTLDVNVWVDHYLSAARGREGSAAQRLVRCAFDGHCRLGPIQTVISLAMLDTLQDVLVRLDFGERYADAARNAVEACAIGGLTGQAPSLLLAGGVQPIRDAEDRAVLETAIGGGADLLVTNNMVDFAPAPSADNDAEILRRDASGRADVVLFRHAKLPHGLVIASVFAAKSWLVDGVTPPGGILARFRP